MKTTHAMMANPDLPPARIIVADPAWSFKDGLPGETRGADKNYETLTLSDIMRFPLPPMAEPCLLALWRVAAMQQEALDVLKAWGFSIKTEIVWKKLTKTGKTAIGMGHYTRGAHEVCLIATRGGRFHVKDKSIRSIFETIELEAEIGEHSEKPAAFYELIERLSGEGPYVELFARVGRPGWHCYGNALAGGYIWTPPALREVTPPGEAAVSDAGTATAVCPRCLDIEPGTPGGDPANPHPGPFTAEFCAACLAAEAERRRAFELPKTGEAAKLTRRRLYYGLTIELAARDAILTRGVKEKAVDSARVGGTIPNEDAWRALCESAPAGWFECDAKTDADYPTPIKTNGDLAQALEAHRGVKVPMVDIAKLEGVDAAAAELFALFGGPIPSCLADWTRASAGGSPAPARGRGGRGRGKKAESQAEGGGASGGAPAARDEGAVKDALEAPPDERREVAGWPERDRAGAAGVWIVARVRAQDHRDRVASLSDAEDLAVHGPEVWT